MTVRKSLRHVLMLATLVVAAPADAQSPLEDGLKGALRGCEEWVLNPGSWRDGAEPFVATVGLGDKMALVQSVDEAVLPPPEWRAGNHYWRINSTADAGYILVVSDELPICHITGGGSTDLQPIVNSILASDEFLSRWEKIDSFARDDMTSTQYRNREDSEFSIVISRPTGPGGRLDRVQVLASASLEMGD